MEEQRVKIKRYKEISEGLGKIYLGRRKGKNAREAKLP